MESTQPLHSHQSSLCKIKTVSSIKRKLEQSTMGQDEEHGENQVLTGRPGGAEEGTALEGRGAFGWLLRGPHASTTGCFISPGSVKEKMVQRPWRPAGSEWAAVTLRSSEHPLWTASGTDPPSCCTERMPRGIQSYSGSPWRNTCEQVSSLPPSLQCHQLPLERQESLREAHTTPGEVQEEPDSFYFRAKQRHWHESPVSTTPRSQRAPRSATLQLPTRPQWCPLVRLVAPPRLTSR